jgi:hypothetical protein
MTQQIIHQVPTVEAAATDDHHGRLVHGIKGYRCAAPY